VVIWQLLLWQLLQRGRALTVIATGAISTVSSA
jgi:hypothetical protein